MKKTVMILLAIMVSIIVYSQTLAEWNEMDDKKFFTNKAMVHRTVDVKKFMKSNDDLPKFEKIGLISFSIFEGSVTERTSLYSFESVGLTDGNARFLIDELFKNTYSEMRTTLEKNHGTPLLLPPEYADTDEKLKILYDTPIELSKLYKATAKFESAYRGGLLPDLKADVEGLRRIGYPDADPKTWRQVGKIAGELGLDAVVVVENMLTTSRKGTYLTTVKMSLIGPNTVPYNEKDKKRYAPMGPLKGYLEGTMLGSITMFPPKGHIKVLQIKPPGFDFRGVGSVYSRILNELLVESKAAFAKLEK